MERGIAVTGMGIISALGSGIEEALQSLKAGLSGLSSPQILQTHHNYFPVGEVKISNGELAAFLDLPSGHSFTRAAMLGALAAKEAIRQSNLSKEELKSTAFISSTSVGGIDYTEKYFDDFAGSDTNRRFIRAQHPGFTTTQMAGYLGLLGYTTTISTACSSSANAIMLGARMIKAGQCKRVIVGGTDCLSKFTLNGFNSLMILSRDLCKPFDDDRNGLNLGEGAAWLVLEAEELTGDKPVLGRVAGYGNANDAFHQTASSEKGEGAYRAMQNAIKIAGISNSTIEYINAHGTGTKNNDLSESMAMKRIFPNSLPAFSSTKSYTGHTLAAAGAIEAVFSLLSFQEQRTFPNLYFQTPMQETGLHPVRSSENKNLKYILSNSFGFGGNCTSLIFSKNED